MDVRVIQDKSGSMMVLGKQAIADMVFQTLDCFPEISAERLDWSGTRQEWDSLVSGSGAEKLLVITDGYALSDNAIAIPENASVILCGGDRKRFSGKKSASIFSAENAVKCIETLILGDA